MTVLNYLDSPGIHQQGVTWCMNNALVINTSKTEEFVFGSKSDTHTMPVFIHDGQNIIFMIILILFVK